VYLLPVARQQHAVEGHLAPGLGCEQRDLDRDSRLGAKLSSTGGAQFRAEPGVTIKVPLLEAEPGSKVTFDRVLLASDGKHVQAGKPVVKGAKVTAEVVRHGKGEKIKIYRFARRSGYRRHAGHRQPFTEVKIADVKLKD